MRAYATIEAARAKIGDGYKLALATAPFTVSLKSQPFLPATNGRIAFSQRLLSSGTFTVRQEGSELGLLAKSVAHTQTVLGADPVDPDPRALAR
jgi:hypothetical protein